ncbi:hypothetical protein EYF80_035215 [Liparis tanakae]|uniref:Uncharacterized protein n=1 Tax=Liparis tanakae TaxID=230148 RepID=A0A4Z2GMZ4_9TELE|nr:hypothetical protein EYF80_035215 [Liparis tanakae]
MGFPTNPVQMSNGFKPMSFALGCVHTENPAIELTVHLQRCPKNEAVPQEAHAHPQAKEVGYLIIKLNTNIITTCFVKGAEAVGRVREEQSVKLKQFQEPSDASGQHCLNDSTNELSQAD